MPMTFTLKGEFKVEIKLKNYGCVENDISNVFRFKYSKTHLDKMWKCTNQVLDWFGLHQKPIT